MSNQCSPNNKRVNTRTPVPNAIINISTPRHSYSRTHQHFLVESMCRYLLICCRAFAELLILKSRNEGRKFVVVLFLCGMVEWSIPNAYSYTNPSMQCHLRRRLEEYYCPSIFISSSLAGFSLEICAPNMFPFPAARFLADAFAKRDLGFALLPSQFPLLCFDLIVTHFPTCLFR
jgi:hypothetical protein